MVLILGLVVAFATTGCLVLGRRFRQDHISRLRDDVRLRVIESQLAAMRAALRIQVAEHVTRRRMHDDLFRNSTLHEEPDLWRR